VGGVFGEGWGEECVLVVFIGVVRDNLIGVI